MRTYVAALLLLLLATTSVWSQCPKVTITSCDVDPMSGDLRITWSSGTATYDRIDVFVDGVPIDATMGADPNTATIKRPLPGKRKIAVRPVCGTGATATPAAPCCVTCDVSNDAGVPSATGFTAVPEQTSGKVTLTWPPPDPCVTAVEIYLDGKLIDTLQTSPSGVAPSSTCVNPLNKKQKFSVRFRKGASAGAPVDQDVIVVPALDCPPVENVQASCVGGNVQITWSNPAGSSYSGHQIYVDGKLVQTLMGATTTVANVVIPLPGCHTFTVQPICPPLDPTLAPPFSDPRSGPGTAAPPKKIATPIPGLVTGTDQIGFAPGISVPGIGESFDTMDGFGGAGSNALIVGVPCANDAGVCAGAVEILYLDGDGDVTDHLRITEGTAGFTGDLEGGDYFGFDVAAVGQLGPDGLYWIAVGAYGDDDGGPSDGATYLLGLNPDGTVSTTTKISAVSTPFLADAILFGVSLAAGDLDLDGRAELFVGATLTDSLTGAFYVLSLNDVGAPTSVTKLGVAETGLPLVPGDEFGIAIAWLGDPDGLGPAWPQVAVGAQRDRGGSLDPAANRGAVYTLELTPGGAVASWHRYGAEQLAPFTTISDGSNFAFPVALPDLDGNGVFDLGIGAIQQEDGVFFVLLLEADGSISDVTRITTGNGGFEGTLDPASWFGRTGKFLEDIDGDGTDDLLLGAPFDGGGTGQIYSLNLLAANPTSALLTASRTETIPGSVVPTYVRLDAPTGVSGWDFGVQIPTGLSVLAVQDGIAAFETDFVSHEILPTSIRSIGLVDEFGLGQELLPGSNRHLLTIRWTAAALGDYLVEFEEPAFVFTRDDDATTRTEAGLVSVLEIEAVQFVRGDCNQDGSVDVGDAVELLGILFGSGLPPSCAVACKVNTDAALDIADAVYLLAFLFQGGPLPPAPHPSCGEDPVSGASVDCANPICP